MHPSRQRVEFSRLAYRRQYTVDGKPFDFGRLSEIQQKKVSCFRSSQSTVSEGSSSVHSEQDVSHNIGEVSEYVPE